jgi:aryl-phospho-beta-D-glucosidase BglC (GH1 family)
MLGLLASFALCADWLHTSGAKIVDEGGSTVRLTGLNWFGFETNFKCFHGLWSCNLHTTVEQVAAHGFNVFRIPVSLELLNDWKAGDNSATTASIDFEVNPDLKGLSGKKIFELFLDDCAANGIKVFIDVHGVTPGSYQNPLWGDPAALYSGLEWFAGNYANDDTIIGIDVKNEPHSGAGCQYAQSSSDAVWDTSTTANNWPYVAGQAGKRILAKNPHLLILVEGSQCYNGDACWWGGQLAGVADIPVDIGDKTHLVYSPHEYGPSVGQQSWYGSQAQLEAHWNKHWLYIVDQGIAPLLIGEWGGHTDSENASWMKACATMIGQKGLSHTFWCLNPDSGDTGGLLDNDWKTWDTAKLDIIKPAMGGKMFAKKNRARAILEAEAAKAGKV